MFRRFMTNRLGRSDSHDDDTDVDSQPNAFSPGGGGFSSAIKNLPSLSLSSLGPSTPSSRAQQFSTFLVEKNRKKIEENTKKVQELASFDACLEACDALAASSTSSGRVDPATGLADCSVLISPDGDLLLIPQEQHMKEVLTSSSNNSHSSSSSTTDTTALRDRSSLYVNSVKELLLTNEEFESAIFRGTDLLQGGDKSLNGFSAQGWSIPAASLAMKQNEYAMADLADFAEDLVLTKKNNAIRESQVLDKLKILVNPADVDLRKVRTKEYQTFLQHAFPEHFPPVDLLPTRVGPLSFPGGTIHATVLALEQYYASVAIADSSSYDKATKHSGACNKLRRAISLAETRSLNRQQAMHQMFARARAMEDHLTTCKVEAAKRWDAVHDAEENVTKLVQESMLERSRLKEQQRLEQMKQEEARRQADEANGNFGATSNEIWDIVSAVAASMEEGSFEPMDLPQAPLSVPRDQSRTEIGNAVGTDEFEEPATEDDLQWAGQVTSRHELEQNCGLPELRVAAMAADEAVNSAGEALLTVLSNMDATKRSACIAAESCLVSACNAQASCLRSMIAMERKLVEERLQRLIELEKVADAMDVRADMNTYIAMDKRETGGRSMLGDDDGGGIASALTVLSNHVDGDMGLRPARRLSSTRWDDDDSTSPELLEEAVEALFIDNKLLRSDATDGKRTAKARGKFESTVEMLCRTGKDKSSAARSRRSNIAYALNARRSRHSRILTSIQFDGLCRVFASLLSGCDSEGSGVSIAKMCMMLSQTFYFDESNGQNTAEETDYANDSRKNRVYVKSCLVDHQLWKDDTYW
jgi:hypothetical protein